MTNARKAAEADYPEWHIAQRGSANPQIQTNAFWLWAIESQENAHSLHAGFSNEVGILKRICNWALRRTKTSSFPAQPRWCFDRLGQAKVHLPDGSKLLIAGEHEDHYDPDFYIYNDVVKIAPDGRGTVYGYSEAAFPPTDFHSATLVGDTVFLIGNPGYPQTRRRGETQALSLSTKDWSVSQIDTTGHCPGWIHCHSAVLSSDGRSILVSEGLVDNGYLTDNFDEYELCLETATWTRVRVSNFQRWVLEREDDDCNSLWEIRNSKSNLELGLELYQQKTIDELYKDLPDHVREELKPKEYSSDHYRRVDELYNSPFDQTPPVECAYNIFKIVVDGVPVRFTEESCEVVVVVEGALAASKLDKLLHTIQQRLSDLEGVPYHLTKR